MFAMKCNHCHSPTKKQIKTRLLHKRSLKFPIDLFENTTTNIVILKVLVFYEKCKAVRNGLLKTVGTKNSSQKGKVDLILKIIRIFLKIYEEGSPCLKDYVMIYPLAFLRLNYVHQFGLYCTTCKLMQGKVQAIYMNVYFCCCSDLLVVFT